MLLNHSRTSRGQVACEDCHDEGFTVEAIHNCKGCERMVCDGHFLIGLCTECHDFANSKKDQEED